MACSLMGRLVVHVVIVMIIVALVDWSVVVVVVFGWFQR